MLIVQGMPIRLAQADTLGYDPTHVRLPSDSLMKRPALYIWSVSGGQKVLNAHPVFRLVTRGVFRPDHACWNVVSAGTKLVLQRALSCTERGSLCQSGFGLRTW